MRRTALCMLAGLAVTLPACSWFKKKPEQTASTDPYLTGSETTTSAPVYSQPAPVDRSYDPMGGAAAAGSRYHTVARHDTLFSLARTYYGNASRWRDIYEANKAQISDPNKIKVGQKLVIP